MGPGHLATRKGAALLIAALSLWASVAQAGTPTPTIAIVIDDMGDRLRSGMRAVNLDGAVTCAILPGTPYARPLAEAAHGRGKEVMLHLPMEATDDHPLGPGAVTLHMTRNEFVRTVTQDIDSLPYISGINNHMGSLITRHPGHMQWLMELMQSYPDLFFLDSRTTVKSVAQRIAREFDIPNTRRDVFLDDDPSPEAVARQFERLIEIAKRKGTAVGIGHPHGSTLSLLEQRLPGLTEREGVRLVPVSQIISQQSAEGRLWHASLSPLRKVAKNLKPSPLSICCAAPASKSLAPALKLVR
ncbi:MAG: divergent polysaccharide deacetylase family protein [Gammaproteobacteria bacterium]